MRRSIVLTCTAILFVAAPAFGQDRTAGPPTGTWSQPTPPPALPSLPPSSTTITVQAETNTPPAPPAPPPPVGQARARAPEADRAVTEPSERLVEQKFLHGFRLGYAYVANYDKPADSLDGKSLKDRVDMKTPHHFLIGYEGMARMVGHSWLNVILVGNAMVAGLEQSKFYPTGNALIGFEIDNSFQFGVGASLTPLKGQEAHTIVAAGWTPRVGSFYVPLHAFFIPDVDGLHRTGVTTGVTW